MKSAVKFCISFFTALYIYALSGVDAMCEADSTILETAYAGAYEIRFPETNIGIPDFSRCRWLITSYRQDYVVKLQFEDVFLERDSLANVCIQKVVVYDGPATSDTIIASFCGREEPKIMTSSCATLIVLNANKSFSTNSTFSFKYKAVKDRPTSEDTSQILRIAFGVFIGAITFLLLFSWAFRKYKKIRPFRGLFIIGGRRINSSNPSGHHNRVTTARSCVRRVADHRIEGQERASFRNNFTGFFQNVLTKLSIRRATEDGLATSTNDSHCHQICHTHPHHTGRNNCRHSRCSGNRQTTAQPQDSNGPQAFPSNISQNTFICGTFLQDVAYDHMSFDQPIMFHRNFTTDPNAVRPPKYEDCISSINPLHLLANDSNTFYNRAFDLKEEEPGCIQICSPPPPYSETHDIPFLGNIPGTVPQSASTLAYYEPPLYESPCQGTPTTTISDSDCTELELPPEQSCERGESVLQVPTSPERSVLSRASYTTTATGNATTLLACESLTPSPQTQHVQDSESLNNSPKQYDTPSDH